MTPTTFVDFVILALSVPCNVLVLLGYGLLTGALIATAREKLSLGISVASRRAPAKS